VTGLRHAEEHLERAKQELEIASEELQSTNEELEMTNKELQSANEGLQMMSAEMLKRGDELRRAMSLAQSIYDSLDAALVVLDRGYSVVAWNRAAADLWGPRTDEVRGVSFFSLDIGLPLDRLMAPVRATIGGEPSQQVMVLGAVDRRGRAIQVRVDCRPLVDGDRNRGGAVLRMEMLS
jgi:two-component system CheB/CheR fusion protein